MIVIIFIKRRRRHRSSSVSPSVSSVRDALSICISLNNLYHRQRLACLSLYEEYDLTLGTDDQTTALFRALVDGFDNVDQLLLVLQYPIQLIIVTRSEIAHHVFIAVEEHDRHRIVELVHRVKIGDLVDVAQVDDGEVCGAGLLSDWLSDSSMETRGLTLHSLGDLVENFILANTCEARVSRAIRRWRGGRLTVGIVVATEADHHEALLFGENGLVNVPGSSQVRQYNRTHGGVANLDERGARSRKLESSELIAGRPCDRVVSCDWCSFSIGLRQLQLRRTAGHSRCFHEMHKLRSAFEPMSLVSST